MLAGARAVDDEARRRAWVAASSARAVLRQSPHDAQAQLDLGGALWQLGHAHAAVRAWTLAAALPVAFPAAALQLARAYLALGDVARMGNWLARGAKTTPHGAPLCAAYVHALVCLNRVEDARKILIALPSQFDQGAAASFIRELCTGTQLRALCVQPSSLLRLPNRLPQRRPTRKLARDLLACLQSLPHGGASTQVALRILTDCVPQLAPADLRARETIATLAALVGRVLGPELRLAEYAAACRVRTATTRIAYERIQSNLRVVPFDPRYVHFVELLNNRRK